MSFRTLAVAVAVISGLFGLLRATDAGDVATTPAPDWYSRVADVDAALSASGAGRMQGLAHALDGGLIFPDPYLAPGSAAALAAASETGAVEGEPPVPTIIAAGIIDGVPGVQLMEGAGEGAGNAQVMATLRVGDTTPGGWTLVATDLSTAELVWKDVTRTLDIRPAAPLERSSRNRNNPRQR